MNKAQQGEVAKIIAKIINRTRIDDDDVEVIEVILQDALKDYHDEGYEAGYYEGYEAGYSEGHSDSHSAV